ncbi:hypothetical protein DPEC_G00327230 [Dallia pectoralis]|uniref:Uncharacterized protein n=1 Tax=Dallia pectoralis TaxID=75939 RepID=A0ACC2F822_DALPE|nr:hypothetical protein DPEC_G00327230 [Dallia pectoralis]
MAVSQTVTVRGSVISDGNTGTIKSSCTLVLQRIQISPTGREGDYWIQLISCFNPKAVRITPRNCQSWSPIGP